MEIDLKEDPSHRLFHGRLPHAEEICFIYNVQEVVIILKHKTGHY